MYYTLQTTEIAGTSNTSLRSKCCALYKSVVLLGGYFGKHYQFRPYVNKARVPAGRSANIDLFAAASCKYTLVRVFECICRVS